METVNIYKITDTTNGIIYIGQTVQMLRKRWKRHVYDAIVKNTPQAFHQAIRDHGESAFVVEKIDETSGKEQGDSLETFYISQFGATNPEIGYNRMLGGRAGRHIAENKLKISEKSREWWSDPENKKRASESRKGLLVGERNPMFGRRDLGKPHTDETKQHLSETRKELFQDPEFKTRMSEANTGKHHTTEGKAHIAEALRGNQYRKGIPHDEETKARIAASMRLAWDRKKSHQVFLDAAVYQTEKEAACA